MIRCGIDASSSCTGVCIFDNEELIYYGKFRPIKPKGHKGKMGFRANAASVVKQVSDLINLYCPDIIYMEDVPTYVNNLRGGVKQGINLGTIQGIFYYIFTVIYGYKIQYVDVAEWRQKLGFLKGPSELRKREEQKAKAVDFVNKRYGLHLYFDKTRKIVDNDDDIAEAICIAVSQMIK